MNKQRIVRIGVISGLFLTLILLNYINVVTEFTVLLLSYILSAFIGVISIYDGHVLLIPMGDNTIAFVSVSPEYIILMFIVISFLLPAIELKDRFKSFTYVPLLYTVNLTIILLSILTGYYLNNVYAIVLIHNSFGQFFMLLSTTLIFVMYLRKIRCIKGAD